MPLDRREFLRGAGIGALAFTVGGVEMLLTPSEAHAAAADLRVLAPAEVRALEAIGEVLLPGARAAGITHFVDSQLAAEPAQSLLMLRYLDVPPPYADFYRGVLGAVDGAARAAHGKAFADLAPEAADALVTAMSRGTLEGWAGPPAPFAFFVLRNDAVDVVYGTVEGFEKLGVPYMPHILPPSNW
jgi:hypothetical protein